MKRLVTILLSAIMLTGLSFGQTAPVVVYGNVKVATGGNVKSAGTVNVKSANAPHAKGVIVNEGTLNLGDEGIIFYSNGSNGWTGASGTITGTGSDGLLVNKTTVNYSGDASKIRVRKEFPVATFWYSVSFPFDVNIADIQTTGSTAAKYRTNYWVYEYDSDARANNGDATVGNWKRVPAAETYLKAGKGYRVLSQLPELEFPAKALATYSNSSLFTYANKSVPVTDFKHANEDLVGYYQEGRGWNYIGGLNTSNFNLAQMTTDLDWNETIYYMDVEGGSVEKYKPRTLSTIHSPYTPFFVQISDNGSFTYKKEGITLDAHHFRSSERTANDILSLTLINDENVSDVNYIVLGDKYKDTYLVSEDAFKPVYDDELQIYSVVENVPLFRNALLRTGEKEVILGVSAPFQGQYTFELTDENNSVNSVVLLDKENNQETDLLSQTYSFYVDDVFNTSDRFVLYINKTATSIGSLGDASKVYAYADNAVLTVKNLKSGDNVQILDLAGRTIASGIAQGSEYSMSLKEKGVYIVNVKGEKNTVLKVLNR
ncbi:MAG: T9SS type A sorting domain-containing protein [Candidatus Symbiothrix sp.]|jgi:hypothetical protein|nr:T9SS type A sorting domain-containing protein [Candidatus Symbiothrix sp.]